ncbi:hypothetical protein KHA80_12990 [Anaerobacillus sp. HL2]|nr:hypothetical protein KHA80_12990 [Anaerobacillus sp. HL2]
MQVPSLKINSKSCQICLPTAPPSEVKQKSADLSIKQEMARIEISHTKSKLEIDQTEAFADANLKSPIRSANEFFLK